jgi:hypothetical protein
LPVESEVNVEQTRGRTRLKHGTARYKGVTSLDVMLRLIYCKNDVTCEIMRAGGREILALSIDLLRDVVTGFVRCGVKNESRSTGDLERGGKATFVSTAPKLDGKFEKQSEEHELVKKGSPYNNQNEKRI